MPWNNNNNYNRQGYNNNYQQQNNWRNNNQNQNQNPGAAATAAAPVNNNNYNNNNNNNNNNNTNRQQYGNVNNNYYNGNQQLNHLRSTPDLKAPTGFSLPPLCQCGKIVKTFRARNGKYAMGCIKGKDAGGCNSFAYIQDRDFNNINQPAGKLKIALSVSMEVAMIPTLNLSSAHRRPIHNRQDINDAYAIHELTDTDPVIKLVFWSKDTFWNRPWDKNLLQGENGTWNHLPQNPRTYETVFEHLQNKYNAILHFNPKTAEDALQAIIARPDHKQLFARTPGGHQAVLLAEFDKVARKEERPAVYVRRGAYTAIFSDLIQNAGLHAWPVPPFALEAVEAADAKKNKYKELKQKDEGYQKVWKELLLREDQLEKVIKYREEILQQKNNNEIKKEYNINDDDVEEEAEGRRIRFAHLEQEVKIMIEKMVLEDDNRNSNRRDNDQQDDSIDAFGLEHVNNHNNDEEVDTKNKEKLDQLQQNLESKIRHLREIVDELRSDPQGLAFNDPDGAFSSLFDYQRDAILFGVSRNGRCMLADEMGVGKSIESLGIAYHYRETDWPLLIICPPSLKFNWYQECTRWLNLRDPKREIVLRESKDNKKHKLETLDDLDVAHRKKDETVKKNELKDVKKEVAASKKRLDQLKKQLEKMKKQLQKERDAARVKKAKQRNSLVKEKLKNKKKNKNNKKKKAKKTTASTNRNNSTTTSTRTSKQNNTNNNTSRTEAADENDEDDDDDALLTEILGFQPGKGLTEEVLKRKRLQQQNDDDDDDDDNDDDSSSSYSSSDDEDEDEDEYSDGDEDEQDDTTYIHSHPDIQNLQELIQQEQQNFDNAEGNLAVLEGRNNDDNNNIVNDDAAVANAGNNNNANNYNNLPVKVVVAPITGISSITPGLFKTIIIDESHTIKNIMALRTREALKLASAATRVVLLSGTPTLAKPFELLPQFTAVCCSGTSSARGAGNNRNTNESRQIQKDILRWQHENRNLDLSPERRAEYFLNWQIPVDVWLDIPRILNEAPAAGKKFGPIARSAFQYRYCQGRDVLKERMGQAGGFYPFFYDKGNDHIQELQVLFKAIMLRRTKKECLDLPEKHRQIYWVDTEVGPDTLQILKKQYDHQQEEQQKKKGGNNNNNNNNNQMMMMMPQQDSAAAAAIAATSPQKQHQQSFLTYSAQGQKLLSDARAGGGSGGGIGGSLDSFQKSPTYTKLFEEAAILKMPSVRKFVRNILFPKNNNNKNQLINEDAAAAAADEQQPDEHEKETAEDRRIREQLQAEQRAGDLTFDRIVEEEEELLQQQQQQQPKASAANQHKVLFFAHHKIMMDCISDAVRSAHPDGVDHIRIDGSVPTDRRGALVNHFSTNPSCRAAVLSIQSSSVGLNLTAANTVVFAELDWSPDILVQCEDRVHRIGQKYKCEIKYLLGPGTLDEVIWKMLDQKLSVTRNILADGAAAEKDTKMVHQEELDNVNERIMQRNQMEAAAANNNNNNNKSASTSARNTVGGGTHKTQTTLDGFFAKKKQQAQQQQQQFGVPESIDDDDDSDSDINIVPTRSSNNNNTNNNINNANNNTDAIITTSDTDDDGGGDSALNSVLFPHHKQQQGGGNNSNSNKHHIAIDEIDDVDDVVDVDDVAANYSNNNNNERGVITVMDARDLGDPSVSPSSAGRASYVPPSQRRRSSTVSVSPSAAAASKKNNNNNNTSSKSHSISPQARSRGNQQQHQPVNNTVMMMNNNTTNTSFDGVLHQYKNTTSTNHSNNTNSMTATPFSSASKSNSNNNNQHQQQQNQMNNSSMNVNRGLQMVSITNDHNKNNNNTNINNNGIRNMQQFQYQPNNNNNNNNNKQTPHTAPLPQPTTATATTSTTSTIQHKNLMPLHPSVSRPVGGGAPRATKWTPQTRVPNTTNTNTTNTTVGVVSLSSSSMNPLNHNNNSNNNNNAMMMMMMPSSNNTSSTNNQQQHHPPPPPTPTPGPLQPTTNTVTSTNHPSSTGGGSSCELTDAEKLKFIQKPKKTSFFAVQQQLKQQQQQQQQQNNNNTNSLNTSTVTNTTTMGSTTSILSSTSTTSLPTRRTREEEGGSNEQEGN